MKARYLVLFLLLVALVVPVVATSYPITKDIYNMSVLHFTGVNGGLYFKDENQTVVWQRQINGVYPEISTGAAEFNVSSGMFGGYVQGSQGVGWINTTSGNATAGAIWMPRGDNASFTVSAWVKSADAIDSLDIAPFSFGTTGESSWSESLATFDMYDGASYTMDEYCRPTLSGNLAYPSDKTGWHYVMFEKNGVSLEFKGYLDGALQFTKTNVEGVCPSARYMSVGGSTAGIYIINGYIDEVVVMNGTARSTALPIRETEYAGTYATLSINTNATTRTTFPFPVLLNATVVGLAPEYVSWFVNTSLTTGTWYNYTTESDRNLTYILTYPGHYRVNLSIGSPIAYPAMGELAATPIIIFGNATLQADFNGTPRYLHPYTDVNFVDMSTGDSLYNWSWDFGDKNTSYVRNPYNTYGALGSFNVNLTVKGVDGQSIINKTAYIRVNWNNTFTLQIRDASTYDLIISPVIVTLSQLGVDYTTATTSTGVIAFELPDGTYDVMAQSPGLYDGNIASVIMAGTDANGIIYLSFVGSTAVTQTIPKTVTLVCTDFWGNSIPNLNVSAHMLNFSAPEAWFRTYYGISTLVDISNTTLYGISGDDGSWAAPMVGSVRYNFSFTGPGITPYSLSFYPSNDEYYIRIPTAGVYVAPTPSTNYITFSMVNTTVSSTQEVFTVTYQDTSGGTSALNLTVYNTTGVLLFAGDSPGMTLGITAPVVLSSGVLTHAPGDTYTYKLAATQSQVGSVNQTASITWQNLKTLAGYPAWVSQWMGISILILLAGSFALVSIKFAMVIIPVLTYFMMYYMQWIDPVVGMPLLITSLGVLFAIGILRYMREQRARKLAGV